MVWRVTSPYFCAHIISAQDGVITDAAPILRFACNNPIGWFKQYCYKKGWTIEHLDI